MITNRISGTLRQSYDKVHDELKAARKEEWSDAAVETYLADSLWLVYYGIMYTSRENDRLPDDVNNLAGSKYVPEWPENPFNDWKPMKVSSSEAFSPGDMMLQVCAPEFYSRMDDPRPLSIELAIFGPNEEFAANGNAKPLDLNIWAHVPNGSLYELGAYSETADHARTKWEQFQRDHPADGGATQ